MAIDDNRRQREDGGGGRRGRDAVGPAPVRESSPPRTPALRSCCWPPWLRWSGPISPWSAGYESLWHTEVAVSFGDAGFDLDLRHWINDGLMAFFFVVGLEIRREFDMGELRERRRVATPVLAAVGGMAVPALIYLAINAGASSSARGWGIAGHGHRPPSASSRWAAPRPGA